MSLQFYSDSGLTTPVTQLAALHLVDGSTDPRDLLAYLGSSNAAEKFQAASNPGVNQITLTIENVTAVWTASTAKVIDNRVRTTAKNGYKYKCTVAGTTGTTEPTWPIIIGNTVVDGTVTWQCEKKIHESTECKIALTFAGLPGATPGASLNVGTEILGGVAGAKSIYIRLDDVTMTQAAALVELRLRHPAVAVIPL